MKHLVKAAAVAILLATSSPAQETDIQATISNQFEAFRSGDIETAFSYAVPSLQMMFGSSQRFGRMVQQGYPMVWTPGDVRFLELRKVGEVQFQTVMVTSVQGQVHLLEYRMQQTAAGWGIGAVRILPTPDLGV